VLSGPVAGGGAGRSVRESIQRSRRPPWAVVPAGMILAAGAAAWLTGIGVHGGYGTRVAPALVLIGLGIGCIVTPDPV
jgi:hypothetical protein